jgi:septal ring factor EnvC (AmiA/AmiB activator)
MSQPPLEHTGIRFERTINAGHLLTAGALVVSVVLAYADLAAGLRTEREHRMTLAKQVEIVTKQAAEKQREDTTTQVTLARINEQIAALRDELRRAISRADRTNVTPWAPAAREIP